MASLKGGHLIASHLNTVDGGWSTCRFRRALDTGDSAGDLPIVNGNMVHLLLDLEVFERL